MKRTWPHDWQARRAGQDCPKCGEGRPDACRWGVRFFAGQWADAYLQRRPPQPGTAVVVFRGTRHVANPCHFTDDELVATGRCAVPLQGHHRVLLCAADICASAPSLELAARAAPGVPVTNPAIYQADPWCALIDCSAAAATLGWQPARRWPQREPRSRK